MRPFSVRSDTGCDGWSTAIRYILRGSTAHAALDVVAASTLTPQASPMNSRRFIPYSSELEDDKTQRTTSRLWLRSPQAQMLRQNAAHRGRRLRVVFDRFSGDFWLVEFRLTPMASVAGYDKLAANYLAFIRLASIRLWLTRRKPIRRAP